MVLVMKNALLVLGFFSLVVACGASDSQPVVGQTASEVKLDVRCTASTDCPAEFECETETENNVSTSFCKSHHGARPPAVVNGEALECENELEHGVTTTKCKPHGGDDDDGHGGEEHSGKGREED